MSTMKIMSETDFITNENGNTLENKFKKNLKETRFFDILVGYFRMSGFNKVFSDFENIEKIRILVGLNVDYDVYDSLIKYKNSDLFSNQKTVEEIKIQAQKEIKNELEKVDDGNEEESSIRKFMEFLNSGKLEIRGVKNRNTHAKLYIMKYKDNNVIKSSVILGSSNLSISGLVSNTEFNYEIKTSLDCEYASKKFDELWDKSVELNSEYVEILKKSWLRNTTPYEIYIKTLYEVYKDRLEEEKNKIVNPEKYLSLKYQEDASVKAKTILDKFNGCILADEVGLGKTITACKILKRLGGKKKLIICPPALIYNWKTHLENYNINNEIISRGKINSENFEEYLNCDTVVIDEGHNFRNDNTKTYDNLAKLCKNKKVIILTATPFNNRIDYISSLIYLFQDKRNSNIPNLVNLEKFFNGLKTRESKLKDNSKNKPIPIKDIKEIAEEIRTKILRYVMIRRIRKDIKESYKEDFKDNELNFPTVKDPILIKYSFDEETNEIFNKTLELIKKFKYSKYTPMKKEYYKKQEEMTEKEKGMYEGRNMNMISFLKKILLKRLESSFFAFKQTVDRFIKSYENYIDFIDKRNLVPISKEIDFELDDEEIDFLLNNDEYNELAKNRKDFENEFFSDLDNDLMILKEIKKYWTSLNEEDDEKINTFVNYLKNNIKPNKLIIFTESKETGDFLFEKLLPIYKDRIILFNSKECKALNYNISKDNGLKLIRDNFDPQSNNIKDDVDIIITTDVLAEGVNLHRANSIINYDLPWNPTRLIQRIGRINRVGSKNGEIYIYNLYPSERCEEEIKLAQTLKRKISLFNELLGTSGKVLTEEEILESKSMFEKIEDIDDNDKNTSEETKGEEKYFNKLKKLINNDKNFRGKVEQLPNKIKSCRKSNKDKNNLLTFYKKNSYPLFVLNDNKEPKTIPSYLALEKLECNEDEKGELLPNIDDLYSKTKEFIVKNIEEKEEKAKDITLTKAKEKELNKVFLYFLNKEDLRGDQKTIIEEYFENFKCGSFTKKSIENVINNYKRYNIETINDFIENLKDNFILKEKHIHKYDKEEIILSEYFINY